MLDAKTPTAEQNVPIRRAEPRFPSYGHGELAVIHPARPERLKARIVDVSRSGLQVEISEPVESGSSIELRLPNISVLGQVGSCRAHDSGSYRLGVVTERVSRPLTARRLLGFLRSFFDPNLLF
jgi:hypothetical protein